MQGSNLPDVLLPKQAARHEPDLGWWLQKRPDVSEALTLVQIGNRFRVQESNPHSGLQRPASYRWTNPEWLTIRNSRMANR